MKGMMQGYTTQLYPLVACMERANRAGANYELDIMVFSEEKIIYYYDLRMKDTQVMGTLYNPNEGGVPYSQLDVGIEGNMVLEFEHYLNVVDAQGEPCIRCNFYKVSTEKKEEYYYHMEAYADSLHG